MGAKVDNLMTLFQLATGEAFAQSSSADHQRMVVILARFTGALHRREFVKKLCVLPVLYLPGCSELLLGGKDAVTAV